MDEPKIDTSHWSNMGQCVVGSLTFISSSRSNDFFHGKPSMVVLKLITSGLAKLDVIRERCVVNTQWMTSWWLNQPLWKICLSKWESSLNRGENKKKIKPPSKWLLFQSTWFLFGKSFTEMNTEHLINFFHRESLNSECWAWSVSETTVANTHMYQCINIGSMYINISSNVWSAQPQFHGGHLI